MHRRAQNCDLCGQKFFPESMKFHLVACNKKQAYIEIPCPYCQKPFLKKDMQEHVVNCKSFKAYKKQSSQLLATTEKQTYKQSSLKQTQNIQKTEVNLEEYMHGSLIPCQVCGRKFQNDRILKHQNICKKISKPRRVFDSIKQRLPDDLQNQPSLSYKLSKTKTQKKPIQPSKQIQIQKPQMQIWKKQSDDLRQALKAAKQYQQSKPQQNQIYEMNSKYGKQPLNLNNRTQEIQKNQTNSLSINSKRQNNKQSQINTNKQQMSEFSISGSAYGRAGPSGMGGGSRIMNSNITSSDNPFNFR